MAFNGLQPASGPFYLAPGASTGITMWYGDLGDDHGAQWIMAHPIANAYQPPATLQVSNFTKILDYQYGTIQENGAPVYTYSGEYYQYGVTVTNVSDVGVSFSIQGGGNV